MKDAIDRRGFMARVSAFLALPAGLAGLLGRRKAEKPMDLSGWVKPSGDYAVSITVGSTWTTGGMLGRTSDSGPWRGSA